MDIGYFFGKQIDDLVGSVSDTGLFHGVRVGAELVDQTLEPLRHERTGKLYGPCHLIGVGDRHYTGNDRDGYARFPYLIHKVVEKIVVEEHLSSQELAPGLDLFLQMADVLFLIGAFRMDLRITCLLYTSK